MIKKHVMVSHGQQFGEVCQPIFNATPINYVGLAKLYNDGSRSYLISDPAWGETLLKNNYHLAGTEDALVQGPESSHQLWSISSMFSLNQQTQNLFEDCVKNNFGNGITLMERGKDFIEFFHICADSGYENVDPYLAHNIDHLWNYILYIREAISQCSHLKTGYEKKYYLNINEFSGHTKLNQEKNLQINLKRYYLGGQFGDNYFSPREMDCLILLYNNKVVKEQAKILGLSVRTIEYHIENIRRKSMCQNKTELLLKLTRNNLFQSIIRKSQSS